MHYAVPEILNANQKLFLFFTDIYNRSDAVLRFFNWIPNWMGWKKFYTRKSFVLPNDHVISSTLFGLRYLFKLAKCKDQSCTYGVFVWAGEKFNKGIVKKLRKQEEKFEGIYSFNTASLDLFEKYKGKKFLVLEQCIAPYAVEQQLISKEKAKHPGWIGTDDDPSYFTAYIKREEEELRMADAIICPSDFVKESVVGIDPQLESKIHVVPYGVRLHSAGKKDFSKEGPLRILTVGKAGLRKGTPYVLEAAKALQQQARFRWVGDYTGIQKDVLKELKTYIEMTGQVSRHEITEHYKWADIFLLPSVCEGSATVTYEAMQYQLPMIVTNNTGSIIRDGMDGFIISCGSEEDIIRGVLKFYSDRTLLESFSNNVSDLRQEGSYDAYADRLMDTLYQIEEKWLKQVP